MEYMIIVGIVMVSLFSFIVYLAFMFFLPEWVGITGGVAKDAIKSHVQGDEEDQENPKVHQI